MENDQGKTGKIVNAFGFILFIVWIVSIISIYEIKEYSYSFWFCNLAVAILAVACFQKSLKAIYFVLSIGIAFETPMILDWISFLVFGKSLFGIGNFFSEVPFRYTVLSFIRHLLTVPAAVAALAFFKPERIKKKEVLVWAFAVAIIMILSYSFGRVENINCIHKFCFPINGEVISGMFYPFIWTGIVIMVSLIASYLIVAPLHRWIWRNYCSGV